MPSHYKIKGRDILNDMRSGLTAADLMAKYEMSSQVLDSALEQLVRAGVISREEIRRWLSESSRTLLNRETRRRPKPDLLFALRLHDKYNPGKRGVIREITEEGVGVKGLQARLDEVKILELVPDDSTGLTAIVFQAQCRWIKKGADGEYLSGFRITEISEQNRHILRKLIRKIVLGE